MCWQEYAKGNRQAELCSHDEDRNSSTPAAADAAFQRDKASVATPAHQVVQRWIYRPKQCQLLVPYQKTQCNVKVQEEGQKQGSN
jgi:hypothetical protein